MALYVRVPERSSLPLRIDFTDDTGAPVTPVSANWSLTDGTGTIINTRHDVAITPLASTVYILLSNADLLLSENAEQFRFVTVKATYNSATYGNNVPLKVGYTFLVTPLFNVP